MLLLDIPHRGCHCWNQGIMTMWECIEDDYWYMMITRMKMKGKLTYDSVCIFLLEPWQGGEDEAQGGDDYKHARDHCYHLQMQMFNVQVQMFKGGVAGKSDSRWLLSESELALHIHLWRIPPREWDIGHLQKRKTKVSFCLQDGDNDDLSSTWIVRVFEKVPEPFLGDRAHPVPKLLLHIVTLPGREGNQNQPTRKDGCPKYLPISLASVVSTIVNIASFHNWQCKSSRFYRCLGFPPLKLGLSLDAEMKRKEQLTTFEFTVHMLPNISPTPFLIFHSFRVKKNPWGAVKKALFSSHGCYLPVARILFAFTWGFY